MLKYDLYNAATFDDWMASQPGLDLINGVWNELVPNGEYPSYWRPVDLADYQARYNALASMSPQARTWQLQSWPFEVYSQGRRAMLEYAQNMTPEGQRLFFARVDVDDVDQPDIFVRKVRLFDAQYLEPFYNLAQATGFVTIPESDAARYAGQVNIDYRALSPFEGRFDGAYFSVITFEPRAGVNNFFLDKQNSTPPLAVDELKQYNDWYHSGGAWNELFAPLKIPAVDDSQGVAVDVANPALTPTQIQAVNNAATDVLYIPPATGNKIDEQTARNMARDCVQTIVNANGFDAVPSGYGVATVVPLNFTLDWLLLNCAEYDPRQHALYMNASHNAAWSGGIEAARVDALKPLEQYPELYHALDVFIRNWAEVSWALENCALACNAYYYQLTITPVVTKKQIMLFFSYLDKPDKWAILQNFGANYRYTREQFVCLPRGEAIVYGVGGRLIRADVFELASKDLLQTRRNNIIAAQSGFDIGQFLVGFIASFVTAGAASALWAGVSEVLSEVIDVGVDLVSKTTAVGVDETVSGMLASDTGLVPMTGDATIVTIDLPAPTPQDPMPDISVTPDVTLPIQDVSLQPIAPDVMPSATPDVSFPATKIIDAAAKQAVKIATAPDTPAPVLTVTSSAPATVTTPGVNTETLTAGADGATSAPNSSSNVFPWLLIASVFLGS